MQQVEEAGQGNEGDGEMDARWVELNAVQVSVLDGDTLRVIGVLTLPS